MNEKEMREKLAKLHEQMKALNAAAKAEERDLTEEEETQLEELLAEYDGLKAQLEKKQTSAARAARVDAEGEFLSTTTGRITEPEAPKADAGMPEKPVAETVRENVLDDAKGGFVDYGAFCQAVVAGSARGAKPDERLRILNAAYGQNTEVGSEGGFMVAPEYSNRMLTRMGERMDLIAKCDLVSMTSNALRLTGLQDHDRSVTAYRYGGVIVYFVGEADQITRSKIKSRNIDLRLAKMAALSFATEEEIASVVNLGDRLLNAHAGAIGDTTNELLMFGTGVGQPQGAFNSPCCISVTKETGQLAGSVLFENVIEMEADLAEESGEGAEYFYNAECFPQIMVMVMNVGTGGVPVMVVAGGGTDRAAKTIMGRPATKTNHCEALGDAGDFCLGDFSKYVLGVRGATEAGSLKVATAMSVHLRFDYAETAFRSIVELDGQPYYAQSLKPRKGAAAKRESPFVKIAERA